MLTPNRQTALTSRLVQTFKSQSNFEEGRRKVAEAKQGEQLRNGRKKRESGMCVPMQA